jgi:hypothetical protein
VTRRAAPKRGVHKSIADRFIVYHLGRVVFLVGFGYFLRPVNAQNRVRPSGPRRARHVARPLGRHVFIRVTRALHLGAHTSVGDARSQDSKFAVGYLTCRIQSRTERILRQYIWRKVGSNRGGLTT